MRSVWDFHGGIHPEENKQQSTQFPIVDAPLPQKVILPLQQHIGAPAEPVVLVGDKVRTGQLIAKADGFVSANIHATISGTVVAIEDHAIPHASGMTDECIIIESDGQDEWVDLHPVEDWENADVDTLLKKIAEAGIVGMGGAGFPTAVKARTRERHAIDTLVINAAECEPYITSDDMAMRTYPEKVIEGARILCQLVNPSSCLIGIEDNKPEAIEALQAAAKGTHIEVVVIPTKYPSGGEKQLIRILTGREVPSGGLPADIGVVCQNVGTTIAIYKAVTQGEPLISRITTLTGDAFTRLQNFEVRLGTPINELLELGGFNAAKASRLIMGGPMMGFALQGEELPVVKTTNCLLAPTHQEFPDPDIENPCIRCGMCEQACPAELLPQQLHWFAKAQEFEKAQLFNLFDCIECGACAFVCPSHIPLVQYYRYAKSEIRREDEEAKKAERAKIRFEQRQARLERQEAESAARRKARMGAAAKPAAKPAAKKAEPAAPAVDDAEQKKLKIQRAAAAVSVKKAEKALAEAKENSTDNQAELEQTLKTAQQKLSDIDSKLGTVKPAAKPAAPANNPASEAHEKALKQAKIAAAASKAAMKKAEKALAAAQEAGDADEIKAKEDALATAKANAEKAADKQKQLQSAPPAAAPQANAAASEAHEKALKQAKIAAAASKAAIKKAEKALTAAQEAGDADEIKAKEDALATAKINAEKAADKLKQLQSAPPAAAPQTNAAASEAHEKALKQAKIAAAASKAAIKKAEKALAAAQEAGDADEIKAKEDALSAAQSKAEAAAQKLEDLKNNPPAEPVASASPAVSATAIQAADAEAAQAAYEKSLKQAKIAAAASKAAIKKAEKALAAAQEAGDADEIKAKEDALSAAQNKAETAAQKLEGLKNNPPAKPVTAASPSTADVQDVQTLEAEAKQVTSSSEEDAAAREKALKQAKIAAAASKAAVKKAEKALQAAQDSGDTASVSECEQALSQAQEKARTAADKLEAVKASQAVEA